MPTTEAGELEAALQAIGFPVSEADAAARALVLAREERWEEALRLLDELAARHPAAGWPYALRATVHKARRDFAACRRDLDAALSRERRAWIFLERARLFEELGAVPAALGDVEQAIALAGASAELLLRRAHLQACRRHYPLAVEDLTRALESDPGRTDALLRRAELHGIMGRLDLALEDLRRAERSRPGPESALARLHAQVLSGGGEGVEDELEALERDPSWAGAAAFERACLRLKRREDAAAAACFQRALELERAGAGAPRAAFYLSVAKALAAGGPGAPPKADLHICGLGFRPPFSATVEVLRAIRDCDFVFNNLSEPEVAELVHLLAPAWRPAMFDIWGGGPVWARTIFEEVRPGRTVGFVTRGHPLVYGGLALNLIRESRARKVQCRVFSAVSSLDGLSQRPWDVPGALPGAQVFDYSAALSDPFVLDPRLPAVLYFNASIATLPREAYLDLCSVLERRYGDAHPCLYYGRRFDVEPVRLRVGELRGNAAAIDASFTLLLPPLPGTEAAA